MPISKLVDLDSALRALIEPGCSVHLTTDARAATRAIQRVFDASALDLTLIIGRVGGGHAADLLASGLVRRVIAGSYGAVSQHYTGPLAQVQQTYRSGTVEFQHWSFFSLMQRLMAAAQGLPFALTHSLSGSGMARDSSDDVVDMADPFGSGTRVAALRALAPDVAIVHAQAADEQGNTILLPPFEEGAWGARASRRGVIVTAEHIVSTDYIRRNAHLVQLPGCYVTSVAHVPFGAHPGAFGSAVLGDLRRYGEDEDFNKDYFKATRDPAALRDWVEAWILNVGDHARYVEKLGSARLTMLANPDPPHPLTRAAQAPAAQAPVTDTERLMTLAMRLVLRSQASRHYDVYLVGAGLSEVPATAAYLQLARGGSPPHLVMGHGYYGFTPSPGRSHPDVSTATMVTDAAGLYGSLLAGRPGRSLAILGAGQVDMHGNLNSTLVDGKILTGSGGSNDAAAVCDVVVVSRLSKLVDQVEYVTCPGDNVKAIVTEQGIFEKGDGDRMVLTSCFARDAERIRNDGAIALSAQLRLEDPPSEEELALIRQLMPSRYR